MLAVQLNKDVNVLHMHTLRKTHTTDKCRDCFAVRGLGGRGVLNQMQHASLIKKQASSREKEVQEDGTYMLLVQHEQ